MSVMMGLEMPKNRLIYLFLIAAVSLSTIPSLLVNSGVDEDSVRSIRSADVLHETGVYCPSRLPGNPLFEFILAGIVPWGGHIAANLFSLAGFLLSIFAFSILAKRQKYPVLNTVMFALTPILLVNAATAMDYIPGLALLLWAYVCASRESYLASIVLIGFAIGLRLSNMLLIAPLALFMLLKGKGLMKSLAAAALSACIGLAFFVPILRVFGLRMFEVPVSMYHPSTLVLRTGYNGLRLLGLPAFVFLASLAIIYRRPLWGSFKDALRSRSAFFVFESSSLILFALLFILHSDETAYLIPAVPFLYLLLARWVPRRFLAALGVLIIVNAFFSFELKGGASGRREISLRPAWGMLVGDYMRRTEIAQLRNGICGFDGSEKAVILTGMGPQLAYKNPALRKVEYGDISPHLDPGGIREPQDIYAVFPRKVFLVNSLSKENARRLIGEGYDLFTFTELAPSISMNLYGYDPYRQGIRPLEIFSGNAFYKKSPGL